MQIANGGAVIPELQRCSPIVSTPGAPRKKTLSALDLVAINGATAPDLKPSHRILRQADPAQRCSFIAGPGFMTVRGMTMGHLAMQLSWNFPAITVPVRDRTGLTGKDHYYCRSSPHSSPRRIRPRRTYRTRQPELDRQCVKRSRSDSD